MDVVVFFYKILLRRFVVVMKYGYVRVSTKEQNEKRQMLEMKNQGIRKSSIFVDKATGKDFNRPQWQQLKEELQRGDVLFIVSLDRLGRTKRQSLSELKELKDRGVRIMIGDIPTTMTEVDGRNSAMVDMINNILIEIYTTLAEEELKKITVRREEGMKAMDICRETGKKMGKSGKVTGRPSKRGELSKEQERYIKAWLDKSIKLSDCIGSTNLSRATLYRIKEDMMEGSNESFRYSW